MVAEQCLAETVRILGTSVVNKTKQAPFNIQFALAPEIP